MPNSLRAVSVHVVRAATILYVNIMHVQPRSLALTDFALLCAARNFLQLCASRGDESKSGVAASMSRFSYDLASTAGNMIRAGG